MEKSATVASKQRRTSAIRSNIKSEGVTDADANHTEVLSCSLCIYILSVPVCKCRIFTEQLQSLERKFLP